jgi:hypothetical protein
LTAHRHWRTASPRCAISASAQEIREDYGPRRHEVQASAQAMMAQVIEGQPTFDNMYVLVEFVY